MKMLSPMLRCANLSAARVPEKTADAVYSDPRYGAWREAVIGRAGGVCQHQGCARQERRMFADHIVEIRDGGAVFDPANGQCLCGKHHTLKTIAERRRRLVQPRAPKG